MFERMKRKESKEWKREVRRNNKKLEHRKEWFLWLLIFPKQSEKERKVMATNY